MNRKLSKFKALFIGFILTKVIATGFYIVATWTPDLLWTHQTAEAQDVAFGQSVPAQQDTGTFGAEALDGNETGESYAEVTALMEQLEIKRLQLRDEEERLKQERAQLEKLKRELDLKLDELEAVQAGIDAALTQQKENEAQALKAQDEAEAAKLKRLVKVYTSMSPKKAAQIVETLDMEVVYEVFSNMKGEQVGQILTYVDGARAAEITERLVSDGAD